MAKGSRSSVRKTNNQKLKSKVFGPVESARTERLSAKLLELAQQSKPEKAETQKANTEVEAEEPTTDAQADEQTEGLTPSCISCHLPYSLAQHAKESTTTAEEEQLYTALGLSSDILGFGEDGRLLLAF
ncbi:hypothetical protein K490DRAFT_66268 [Saccharata proteae CBS 121410]|uniref:DUF2423 domain-containing protein n=1 Tax=Saccharata proteae CBS 121410 TaxID=1314787 RepID=A0A9P4LYB6_9PEZI|nr:hypothetical protein K490DRAFT_66268 [Saccharata proteae CBS 121410]